VLTLLVRYLHTARHTLISIISSVLHKGRIFKDEGQAERLNRCSKHRLYLLRAEIDGWFETRRNLCV
jgi:hypothetical protein